MTAKDKIMSYLISRDWTPVWAIEQMGGEWYASPSVIGRRCRDLRKEGKLESRLIGGKVHYRRQSNRSLMADEANAFLKTLPSRPTPEVHQVHQESLI